MKKIAIKIKNEEQFQSVIDKMYSNGWSPNNVCSQPQSYKLGITTIRYHDAWSWQTDNWKDEYVIGYEFVDFEVFHIINQLPFLHKPEKAIVSFIDDMCCESLDPETMEKWNDVKYRLMKNRRALKS